MTRRSGRGFLPLDQYAALGDGRSVALVGSDGSIDWWCVPRLDSTPFFDRLLAGDDGGRFALTPEEEDYVVDRRYRPDSNVLEQVFTTPGGQAKVTLSLNSASSGRLPWSELALRVEGTSGSVAFRLTVQPGGRNLTANPWCEAVGQTHVLHLDGLMASLQTSVDVERLEADAGTEGRLATQPGSRSVLAMLVSCDKPLIVPALETIDGRIDRSDQAWREWTHALGCDGLYEHVLRRSALALKLLLFSPTGAIAAAATMGLPERVGGNKTYDYRYAWVRDAAYTIKAFLRVGAVEESGAAFSWLMATIRAHGGQVHTMYSLAGDLAPAEEVLAYAGYEGSGPVRRGNRAREQLQLGVFGDLLETAALFVEQGHVLDPMTRRLLGDLADRCADLWRKPDSGLWELEQAEHYTMSKLGCWTALDRAVRLAEHGQIDASHCERWQRERDRVRDWVDRHCWSDAKQSYTLHAGTERLDASLLLATRFGFERQDRLALTRDAVARELARGPLVYRMSGMAQEEGAFLACAFWLVEAYALLGDREAAVRQMDATLRLTGGNLGLLHEQMDPGDFSMLGNFPQALSHLALIHAALSIRDFPNPI